MWTSMEFTKKRERAIITMLFTHTISSNGDRGSLSLL